MPRQDTRYFWSLARPLIDRGGAERGSRSGVQGITTEGVFIAGAAHNGDLIVRLPATIANELVRQGHAARYPRGGRNWVTVSQEHAHLWPSLIQQARALALDFAMD